MTELRDGFLHHHSGGTVSQVKRLISGEFNPAWDDLFRATIDEARNAIFVKQREREKVAERLARIDADIEELENHQCKVNAAVQQFHETGEIDEVLYPACDDLLAAERQAYAAQQAPTRAEEVAAAEQTVAEKLGDDWKIEESTVDDEFVYITVKQRRNTVPPERPSREKLQEEVRQAVNAHSIDFKDRVLPEFRIMTTAKPRGP